MFLPLDWLIIQTVFQTRRAPHARSPPTLTHPSKRRTQKPSSIIIIRNPSPNWLPLPRYYWYRLDWNHLWSFLSNSSLEAASREELTLQAAPRIVSTVFIPKRNAFPSGTPKSYFDLCEKMSLLFISTSTVVNYSTNNISRKYEYTYRSNIITRWRTSCENFISTTTML